MSAFQKTVKYLAMAVAAFLAVSILGGILGAAGLIGGLFTEPSIAGETLEYTVNTPIQSLDVQINAADFVIREADTFSVESNLKDLSISEENGVLVIKEKQKWAAVYTDTYLTLSIPADTVFEKVRIVTGAAKLTADCLQADTLKLQLGAGDVHITKLYASSKADIEGGAGKITIADGSLKNLELEMGVGELNLTAALLGNSDLAFGVGESNLALLGSRENYAVEMEKGIGSIAIDGKMVTDFGCCGNGANRVEIESGIGTIHVQFRDTGF